VFTDTPGLHRSERKFNRALAGVTGRALAGTELVLYVLDASRPVGPEEEAAAAGLALYAGRTLAAINKMDAPRLYTEEIRRFLREKLPAVSEDRIFGISALKNEGIEAVLARLFDLAEPGEAPYPEDYYTDQSPDFRIAEIIREKAINRLHQELPHSLYVEVADTELREEGARLWVRAFIITERESQKGMVVGKGGGMIKAIREAARKDLNRIFDMKVELDLRVKTARDWRHNDGLLRKLTGP
jgi:GTP-binding protein Era